MVGPISTVSRSFDNHADDRLGLSRCDKPYEHQVAGPEDGDLYRVVPATFDTVSQKDSAAPKGRCTESNYDSSWFSYIPTRLDFSDLPMILSL